MKPLRAMSRPVTSGLFGLIVGPLLIIAGLLIPFLAISYVRLNLAELSSETLTVPAGEDIVFPVEAMDGRFEYVLTSDYPVDFYMLNDEDVPKYEAGQELSVLDRAKDIQHHRTFVQTGTGLDFALVFINSGQDDTSVIVRQVFFPNPPDLVRASILLVPLVVLLTLGGGLMLLIRIIRRLLGKRPA